MTRLRVLEVVETKGLMLAVLQLLNGDIAVGTILTDSNSRWRVTGISTAPAEAWHAGRRGVSLQPIDSRAAPVIGIELAEAQD